MSKETEVVEVEVLTQEQIDKLSEDIQADISYLTENMNSKKLAVLNPVIIELGKLEDRLDKIKLIPAVDGKFDKENIQEFKNLKANTRSFNTQIKAVAKAMKDPLNLTKTHIINIEKGFLESAAKIITGADDKFAPYLEEEAKKAAAAQKKKDDAMNAEILKAKAEADEANKKNLISQTYNKVKYELIMEGISTKTSNMIVVANEDALKKRLSELEKESFGTLITGVDITVLEPEVSAELRSLFATSIHSSIELIKDKLKSIENDKELLIKNANADKTEEIKKAAEVVDTHFPPMPNIPAPPASSGIGNVQVYKDHPTGVLNDQEFINHIVAKKKELQNLIVARINTFGKTEQLVLLYNSLN